MPPKTQAKGEEKKEQKPAAAAPKKEEPKKQPAATKKEEPKPKVAEQPKAKAAEKPKVAAEQPKAKAAEKPKVAAEKPKAAAEKPKAAASEKTKAAAAKPKAAAEKPKAAGGKKEEAKKAPAKKAEQPKAKGDGKRKAPEASTQAAKKQKTEKPAEKTPTKIAGTKSPRNFSVGNDIQPKRDLTRFVKWPKYILMQRQRRVLQHRLKVPPSINQFTKTLDTNTAANLFKLLNKYKPEDEAARRKRLLKIATGQARVKKDKPITVKSGINHVTKLVEDKKAALVVIAHDVDPIELVLYLPALCRKQGIPYCFVKGKARLGQLVHKKTATAVAIKSVKTEDRTEFAQLLTLIRANYNDKYEEMKKKWGGGIMGLKSQAVAKQREKVKKQEEKKKAIKFK